MYFIRYGYCKEIPNIKNFHFIFKNLIDDTSYKVSQAMPAGGLIILKTLFLKSIIFLKTRFCYRKIQVFLKIDFLNRIF